VAKLWPRDEAGRGVWFRPVFSDIAGDLVAGILLSQLVFYFTPFDKMPSPHLVLRDGEFWLPRERTAWRDEIGISPKQFDRACDLLVTLQLISRRVYAIEGNRTMMHLSLCVDSLKERYATTSPKVKSSLSQTSIPSYMGEVKEMNAKDVQEKLAAAKKFLPETIEVKPTALYHYWGKAVGLHHGTYTPPATQKQLGLLKNFIKAVGPKDAYPVMLKVVANWKDFTELVKEGKNLKVGSAPSILVMLTHADIAVTMPDSKTVVAKAKAGGFDATEAEQVTFVVGKGKK